MGKKQKGGRRKRRGKKPAKGGKGPVGVKLERFKTDKLMDPTDRGLAVTARTKNKYRPNLFAPEINHVSSTITPHVNTTNSIAPIKGRLEVTPRRKMKMVGCP